VRALVVTNMYPAPDRPALGSFVRDQVEALRRRDDVEVELFAFSPGLPGYPAAARELRRRFRGERFDVVHAHFGLTAWPAVAARLGPVVVTLHGNDLFHPRSNRLSRAILPLVALPAAVSREFSSLLRGAGTTRRVAILPVGIDLARFRAIPRAAATCCSRTIRRARSSGSTARRRRRRASPCSRWAVSRPPTCPTGSTRRTRCWCRRRRRGSGWR
jgi:teichuronic acid biosynthesis glycosyltransferase TuaC